MQAACLPQHRGPFMATKTAKPPRFVDDYLPALVGPARQLISTELHVVARQQGF